VWHRRAGLALDGGTDAADPLAAQLTAGPDRDAVGPLALQLSGKPREAAQLWREIGCPSEAALALADVDQEDALRQSLEQLPQLGAQPAATRVVRRLRELGARGCHGALVRTRAEASVAAVRLGLTQDSE
jgi:hypothetical protein